MRTPLMLRLSFTMSALGLSGLALSIGLAVLFKIGNGPTAPWYVAASVVTLFGGLLMGIWWGVVESWRKQP